MRSTSLSRKSPILLKSPSILSTATKMDSSQMEVRTLIAVRKQQKLIVARKSRRMNPAEQTHIDL